MEIRNEIKQKEDKKQFVQRSLADIQRAKLNKLMENPDKPVIIPENSKKDKDYVAPAFIRNVMGSSAGAGSGEFHVYRHLRRKEFARQKHMKILTEKEIMDQQFQQKLEDNQRIAEERTNKKREKRLKKKKNQKNKAKKPKIEDDDKKSDSELSENDSDQEEQTVEDQKIDETTEENEEQHTEKDQEVPTVEDQKTDETTEERKEKVVQEKDS